MSESIKTQTGDWCAQVEAWKTSLVRLVKAGIRTVCYNFMPVLDWTRTDPRWEAPDGARAMRFDLVDFVAFDIHILQRAGAADDWTCPAFVEIVFGSTQPAFRIEAG